MAKGSLLGSELNCLVKEGQENGERVVEREEEMEVEMGLTILARSIILLCNKFRCDLSTLPAVTTHVRPPP